MANTIIAGGLVLDFEVAELLLDAGVSSKDVRNDVMTLATGAETVMGLLDKRSGDAEGDRAKLWRRYVACVENASNQVVSENPVQDFIDLCGTMGEAWMADALASACEVASDADDSFGSEAAMWRDAMTAANRCKELIEEAIKIAHGG